VSWGDEDEHCDSEFVEDINQSVVYECPECKKLMKKNIWIPCVVKKHNQNFKSMSPYVHNDKLNEMCSGFYRGAYATIYVIQSLSKPL
jgi:hypothetical protein